MIPPSQRIKRRLQLLDYMLKFSSKYWHTACNILTRFEGAVKRQERIMNLLLGQTISFGYSKIMRFFIGSMLILKYLLFLQ